MSIPLEKYGGSGLKVTWLSSQLWCEQQLDFRLKFGEKKTIEKRIGKDRHQELYEEITTLVPVLPRTIEDMVATRFHNIQVGISNLLTEGLTRELPTFGKINSIFVKGIIDELKIQNGLVKVIDHKTRRSNRMPGIAQKITTEFQLMLYYDFLNSCRLGKVNHLDLMNHYKFDSTAHISNEFKDDLDIKGQSIESNVEKLAKNTFDSFRKIPELSPELTIMYEHQETKNRIGEHIFVFDNEWFSRNVEFVMEYWLGEMKPRKVNPRNSWKCNYCEYKMKCFIDSDQRTLI